MSEENLLRVRLNCCRLCLAPETECISIFNSYAADKEPLSTKIYNCVGIKITADDRLSLRICHSCISYLNSWQSFKNRCQASQNKQRLWLENDKRSDNTITFSSSLASQQHQESLQQHQQQIQHLQQQQKQSLEGQERGSQSHIASSILDGITTLKKRKSLTVYPLPGLEIKTEPVDVDEEESLKQQDESDEMVDPTMFLERTEEEGDEPIMSTNRFDYDSEQQQHQMSVAASASGSALPAVQNSLDLSTLSDTKEAACRACNLKFSTRANARRHERNLHPNLFELSSSPNNVPITKPTAALAAALEMQRAAVAAAAEAAKGSPISTQKYRQEIVNAFNKCEAGGFDYANPDKYQQLLTDEKIVFIQQNDEFLQQYQSMTCRCCNRFYSTYKNFMAHMRKKYAALPRNLCFNCLKLNDSKALFISHLKRRNCINLYKVMHALMTKNPSFAATVAATTAATTERLRARELLVNKMYECKLCPKRFRLRLEFRSHMYEEHADMQRKDMSPTSTQCSFCGLDIDDATERKRHYNNMECMVALRCVTCNSKYDKHQAFMDHVHEQHLAGFSEQLALENNGQINDISPGKKSLGGASSNDESRSSQLQTSNTPNTSQTQAPQKSQYFSRMPQACPICGQQYNNYNNVLRHMESKHPDQLPQTYKCVRCGVGYPRLSNLREHMVTQHAADKARHTGFEYIVNADAVKLTDTNAQNAYSGRYDYVMKDLMSITNGGAMDDDDEQQEPIEQKRKKPRVELNNSNSSQGNNGTNNNNNHYSSLKECPICAAVFSNNIGLSNHMRSHTAAAQSAAAAALAAARNSTPSSLTITATPAGASNSKAAQQQLMFKRNLEQAADRRFRRMRCRICQRRFSSKKSYRFHMLNDHQIKNVQFIKCKLCDAEFAYEKGLKVHMFKIHNTLLKDEMIIKQYECDICSIVYRTEVEMLQHKRNVHGDEEAHAQPNSGVADETLGLETSSGDVSGISTPIGGLNNSNIDAGVAGQLLWYQCKYCPSNFNTNKKLAIHINSHDEFDSNDYSCKDCGNVYSGRKSLWVHRYKKHPQVSDPSECTLCKKVFFDSQMLENHTPTCNRKPITATGALATGAADASVYYKHKTGDDDDDGSRDIDEEGRAAGRGNDLNMMNMKMPEVACTMCGARFTDQELFTKHIEMHEMELYTDNPLAAMFDTGPADPNQFYLDRVNENGEYACDLCTKTFTQMTALKVHRKWHFRGDSKQNPTEADASSREALMNNSSHSYHHSNKQQQQLHSMSSHPHLQGLQAVGLMPNPRPHSKSQKRKLELKCEYCPSTFISNNNLRRHIYELHKDVIRNMPAPPEIELDKSLHCRRCELKFETKHDWIEHKILDARVMKPYGPFQWGCDLCGAYVSRKEKLINHIHNHMKESVIIPAKLLEEQQQQEQMQQQQQQQKQQSNASEATSTQNAIYTASTSTNVASKKVKDEAKKMMKMAEREKLQRVEIKQEIIDEQLQQQQEAEDDDEEMDEDGASVDSGRGAYGERMQEDDEYEGVGIEAEVDSEDDVEDDDDNEDDGEVDATADDAMEEDSSAEDDNDDVVNVNENANDGQEEGEEQKDDSDSESNDEPEDDNDNDEDDDDDEEEVEMRENDNEDDNESESDATNQSEAKAIKGQINQINHRKLVAYNPDSDEVDEDDETEDNSNEGNNNNNNGNNVNVKDEDDDDDDDEDVEDDTVSSMEEVQKHSAAKSRFSCDLCQVYFNSQPELQQHVKMHFLNGPGSVTLTKHNPAKRNSDAMTMSSS